MNSLLVLLGKGGEVDGGLGEVDSLSRAESSVVDGSDSELVAFDSEDLEGENSVIDVDELADGGDLGDVGLRKRNTRKEERSQRLYRPQNARDEMNSRLTRKGYSRSRRTCTQRIQTQRRRCRS